MARYRGREDDPVVLQRARNRVHRALGNLIAEVRAHRAGSGEQGGLRGMLNRL
jgi:hypothetical protein